MIAEGKQRPRAGASRTCDAEAISDEELARAARDGSLADFEELVYRYEKSIFSFIFARCRSAPDAQELTQDTFLKAWHAIGTWKHNMLFKPWLFTIAGRKCVDHHRSAAKPEPPSESCPEAEQASPCETIIKREEGAALWAMARRVLPEPQFECLWLRYVEDMDLFGISHVTSRSQTHVKVLLFRARLTLARHISRTPKRHTGVPNNFEPQPDALTTIV